MSNTSPNSDVLLITRVHTNNKGNQALSAAWVNMLEQAFPGAPVRVLERRPPHLLQYSLAQFAAAKDPWKAFDTVTSKLAAEISASAKIGPAPTPKIILNENIAAKPKFAELRARLNLRSWAAKFGRYRSKYQRRLAAAMQSQLVVVNPAGEFFPDDPNPALYHLLDAHVIHKLGRPTAMVNHTMDMPDPTLRKIIPRLYRDLALVGFRDEKSIGAFEDMGGDLSNVIVTPDLALTTAPPPAVPRRPNTIAVALHSPDAGNTNRLGDWIRAIEALRAQGFEVVLVSNEVPSDAAFFERVQQHMSIRVEGLGLDYDKYAEFLGGFEFLVSSRMHTNILAMVAGTPVIPVEGPSFKISGLFAELGLPMKVTQPSQPNWIEEIVAKANTMKVDREAYAAKVVKKVAAARASITDALVPRLRQAAGQ